MKWNVSWWDIYQSILDTITKEYDKDEYALIHHRKTSIGADSMDNVHPFPIFDWRFFLLQNGSSQIMHDWGIIHFLSEVKTNSDTYYLSKFIEEKGCWSLDSIKEILSSLIKTWVKLGVVVVVDTSTDEILMLSDGWRSLYIDINHDETIINSFSSLTEDWDDSYSFRWFIILDFNWNIQSIDYEYLNKMYVKPVTVPATSYHWTQPSLPYADQYWYIDEEEEYYKKKDQKLLLASWDDFSSEVDYIDPAIIIDSKELKRLLSNFWETESTLNQLKLSGTTSWTQWDLWVYELSDICNNIHTEMEELADDFYATYTTPNSDYIYEYVDAEKVALMEMVMEYNQNFEYVD